MSNTPKIKKVPLRKCVVTNEQHPKMEMFRIVRTPENEVIVDLKGKVKGHGAYVLKDKKTILTCQKKKLLNRHLEIEVPDEIYIQMLDLLTKDGIK